MTLHVEEMTGICFPSLLCCQAIFDTEAKQDHAPIVPHCAMSSIESSHSQCVTDLSWIPDHCDVSHKGFVQCHKCSSCPEFISQNKVEFVHIYVTDMVIFVGLGMPQDSQGHGEYLELLQSACHLWTGWVSDDSCLGEL